MCHSIDLYLCLSIGAFTKSCIEGSSEILVAIKAMQVHLEGQILATNQTFQELPQSVDPRFTELQIEPQQFGQVITEQDLEDLAEEYSLGFKQ